MAQRTPPPPQIAADDETIVVSARLHVPGDPLETVNVKSFEVVQSVDRSVVAPLARTYRHVPHPMRSGFRNFLNNLREPVTFVNFLLQIKPGRALKTVGRAAINSSIGVAGLFDIAKRRPFNLPRDPNGFANTLGYYGVKAGPFLFLPLIGPTTVRDLLGGNVDRLMLPLAVGRPFGRPVYAIPVGVLSALDQRLENDEKLRVLHADSSDPYVATREAYLTSREAEIQALHEKRRGKDRSLPGAVDP
ncbi:hypothetical protein BH10PSE13_BH10PSE13_20460 [soil metagenome]